ncbi:(2,3-dihydroxybenzoyl)adenylate synthase [Vibrio sp. WXL210]|uniref:(2,3-dihydroxybenzoyl)adenylate synthase n=1 Tax=Vibrio sp. WXL210 TaxID=3450709 RepID=UPI003EC8EA7E
MTIEFTPWPAELAQRYRQKGYWTNQPLTDIVQRHLAGEPTKIALICGDRRYSYQMLDKLSTQLALQLELMGLEKGDTALVQLPNVAEFYIVYFALLKLGVVPVNALFSHNRLELCAYTEQVSPRLAIVSSRHKLFASGDFARILTEQNPQLEHWVVEGETSFGTSLSCMLANTKTGDEDGIAATQTSLDLNIDASAVAFFQLSGGSTGTPKLIPRTHNDYYYSVRASAEICQLNMDTVYLCALPAAHNFSLSSPGALGVFYAGGTVLLASDPSPTTCFPLIQDYHVTMTALVPPAVTLWLQAMSESVGMLDSLQLLQVGGARLGESLARRISPELGCQLQQVFGMAEGLVNYTRLDDGDWHRFHTQGRPISDDDEIRIVDEDGQCVPAGEPGALITRGPYTIRGYFKSPEHNQQAFDDEGFYRSGDIVSMTPDGYLTVVGRDKDQINRGGEKVAAQEIENQLLALPEITQAALVAMPDSVMGEKSCAYIVSTMPLKPITIRKHLRACGIAEYKLPDQIEQVAELPMTPVGKIDKKALRQRIAEQIHSQNKTELKKKKDFIS